MNPGEVYIVEHKTTVHDIGLGSAYWKRLTLDAQVSTYLPGARALGFEPVAVLYDVAKRPQLRPYLATPLEDRKYTQPKDKLCPKCKKGSAAPHDVQLDDGVMVTCANGRVVTDPGGQLYKNQREHDETVEEYSERLRADIGENPDKYYQRGIVVRLAEEELDAAYDAWAQARQVRDSQKMKRWPRNVDACERWGSFCEFWPVCSNESTIENQLLYRRKTRTHEELREDLEQQAPIDPVSKTRLPLLSSSALSCYRTCPRKYFYAYELGVAPVQRSEALRFGTLFHKALEVWWKTVDPMLAIAEIERHEADPFERARARELMLGYHVRWCESQLDVLEVEVDFVAPLVNPQTLAQSRTFARAGKIDAIARVRAEQETRP